MYHRKSITVSNGHVYGYKSHRVTKLHVMTKTIKVMHNKNKISGHAT